jgi:hypothetical protein
MSTELLDFAGSAGVFTQAGWTVDAGHTRNGSGQCVSTDNYAQTQFSGASAWGPRLAATAQILAMGAAGFVFLFRRSVGNDIDITIPQGAGNISLGQYVSGTPTGFGTIANTHVSGDTYTVDVNGATVSVFKNGTQIPNASTVFTTSQTGVGAVGFALGIGSVLEYVSFTDSFGSPPTIGLATSTASGSSGIFKATISGSPSPAAATVSLAQTVGGSNTYGPQSLAFNASSGKWEGEITGLVAGTYTCSFVSTNSAGTSAPVNSLLTIAAIGGGGIGPSALPFSLFVSPAVIDRVLTGGAIQFSANLTVGGVSGVAPSPAWSVASGGGSITTGGLYTAGNTSGAVTINVTSSGASAQAMILQVTSDMDPASFTTLKYQGGIYTGQITFTTGTGRVKVIAQYGGTTEERIFGPAASVPIYWNLGVTAQEPSFVVLGLPAV